MTPAPFVPTSSAMAFAWHINFRLVGGRVVAPDPQTQRRVARALLAAAEGSALLAFCVADTHVHLLIVGTRQQAAEVVRRFKIALARLLGSPSTPGFYKGIRDQHHLETAFHYVLGQARHHGFAHDPFAEATNLPDLLGLRELGAWTRAQVRAHLPRVDREALIVHYGLSKLSPLDPVPDELLAPAAEAAACLPTLRGSSAEHLRARRAALACTTLSPSAAAPLLSTSRATLYRLLADEPNPRLVRAIGLQASLRARPPTPGLLAEPRAFWGHKGKGPQEPIPLGASIRLTPGSGHGRQKVEF